MTSEEILRVAMMKQSEDAAEPRSKSRKDVGNDDSEAYPSPSSSFYEQIARYSGQANPITDQMSLIKIANERSSHLANRLTEGVTEPDAFFREHSIKIIRDAVSTISQQELVPLFENWFKPAFVEDFVNYAKRASDQDDLVAHAFLAKVHIVDRIRICIDYCLKLMSEKKPCALLNEYMQSQFYCLDKDASVHVINYRCPPVYEKFYRPWLKDFHNWWAHHKPHPTW